MKPEKRLAIRETLREYITCKGLTRAQYQAIEIKLVELGVSKSTIEGYLEVLHLAQESVREYRNKAEQCEEWIDRYTELAISRNAGVTANFSAHASANSNPRMQQMRDSYKSEGQTAAQGPNASASGNTFQQIWQNQTKDIDLPKLAQELERLRGTIRSMNGDGERDAELGQLQLAQKAAAAGDGPKALEYLKGAGIWVLDKASELGVALAVEAIKASMSQ